MQPKSYNDLLEWWIQMCLCNTVWIIHPLFQQWKVTPFSHRWFISTAPVHTGLAEPSGNLPWCVPAETEQVRGAACQNKSYCTSLTNPRRVGKFTYQDRFLQRLAKGGLVFRGDLFQVDLATWHDNSGHNLLLCPFTLSRRAQVST